MYDSEQNSPIISPLRPSGHLPSFLERESYSHLPHQSTPKFSPFTPVLKPAACNETTPTSAPLWLSVKGTMNIKRAHSTEGQCSVLA